MKILLADDHELFRAGLSFLLEGLAADISFHYASNYDQLVEKLTTNSDFDLMLIDLVMPGMGDFESIRRLRNAAPSVPVVVVSARETAEDVRRAMSKGAAGYIPKSSAPNVMVNALKLVLAGGVYLPPHLLQSSELDGTDAGHTNFGALGTVDKLTRRQRDVLNRLVEGKSNKEIASELGLSAGTVKIHVSSIFKTLSVTNRTQAVIVATRELSSAFGT